MEKKKKKKAEAQKNMEAGLEFLNNLDETRELEHRIQERTDYDNSARKEDESYD